MSGAMATHRNTERCSGGQHCLAADGQSLGERMRKGPTITVREGNNTNVDSRRGKLQIVSFDQPQTLQKQGANLFAAPNGANANPALNAAVHQGSIEKSNVNGVSEMAKMIEVMRSYTSIANVIQQVNDIRKQSIERLADVPA